MESVQSTFVLIKQNYYFLILAAGWIIFVIGIAQFPLWAWWYIKTHHAESFMHVSFHLPKI